MTMTASVTQSGITADELAQFSLDGFHVARRLLPPAEVDVIRDTFMQQASAGPVEGLSESKSHQGTAYDLSDPLSFYPRMMHPHLHLDKAVGKLSLRYLLDSRIEAVLTDLLAEEPIACQSMFYFKPPGARGQDLHQDNFYLRVKPGTCMAAWIAVDDADEGNGGMSCVPGTGDLEVACPEKADPALFFTTEHVEPPAGKTPEMMQLRAGDVLFFNGSVIHGSYPNTSKDRFRRSLIFHYVPTSSAEMSKYYKPLLRFDGTEAFKGAASGGGRCGTIEGSRVH